MDAPEAISFHCDHCGTELTVPRSLAGVTGPCPECGEEITSPTVDPSPDEIWALEESSHNGAATPESADDLTRYFEESPPRESLPTRETERARSPQKEERSGSKVLVGMILGASLAIGAWFAFPHVKSLLPQGTEAPAQIESTPPMSESSQRQSEPAPQDDNLSSEQSELDEPIPEGEIVEQPEEQENDNPDESINALGTEIDTEFPISGPDSTLEEPRNFLLQYLTAEKWEDLVPLSINGSKTKSAMADYYSKNPFQPEDVTDLAFQHKQKLPGREENFFLFKVTTTSNPDSFPMTVEETNDGLKTDWETYVQFKDSHLQKFIDNPAIDGEARTFNVMLKRQHYFRSDVPHVEDKWCFSVEAPIINQEGGPVFVPKDSPRAGDYDRELQWNFTYFLIVDLKWVVEKGSENQPYIQLMKIRQFNWRGHDPDFASKP